MGIFKKAVLGAIAVAGAVALKKQERKPANRAKRAVGKARRTVKRVARKGARRIDRTVREAQKAQKAEAA